MCAYIILDVETKPIKHLEEKFTQSKAYDDLLKQNMSNDVCNKMMHRAMSLDPDYCEIACLGIKQIGGEFRMTNQLSSLAKPEWANLLSQFTLVTFSGKKFDLPVIIKQGLREHLDLPYKRLLEACKPWGYGERHIDLLETVSMNGRYKSLNDYLQIYLGEEKRTQGQDFFAAATSAELIQHCQEDLEYTEKLFNFFLPIL